MLDEAIVTAGDIMTRDVAVVHPETSLIDAVKLMARRKVSGVPVVDERGAVIGMMTEGDLVRWHEGYTAKQAHWLDMLADGFELAPSFIEGIRAQQQTVKAVMSPGVTTVVEDTPAREIATLMHTKGIKRVPVMRDGMLVGIVARSDLIRALAQKLEETVGSQPQQAFGTVDESLRRAREEAGIKPRREPKPSTPGAGHH